MFNSIFGHLAYNPYFYEGNFLWSTIMSFGGSEHVALFANDMVTSGESSVEGQRIPIIVKNVPNNAPMGNTVVPLKENYFWTIGPENYDLSGLYIDPPSEINYFDNLSNALLTAFGDHYDHININPVYFFPDELTILYCLVGYDVHANAYDTVDLTIKLAVATQNAATGEIVDEQIFEPQTITNLVADFNGGYMTSTYGFKILGTNFYCIVLEYNYVWDFRPHTLVTLATDRINVNGKSWQVLRNPELHVKAQMQNHFKSWIGHIDVGNQTYVCIEDRSIDDTRFYATSVLRIDNITNKVSQYICNYGFFYAASL